MIAHDAPIIKLTRMRIGENIEPKLRIERTTMADHVKIRRALISVSEKKGLIKLAQLLSKFEIEILSTGGTAKTLRDLNINVKDVSEFTGLAEMLDGRVKTLHPKIHGGILAKRNNKSHREALIQHQIGAIDLVVVNLYPFEKTVISGGEFQECIENIDIGGPTLIRAAAKNHDDVTVLVENDDYEDFINEIIKLSGATSARFRKLLAAKAFCHTAAYDAAISDWFTRHHKEMFPERKTISMQRQQILRYGENPHLKAAFYKLPLDQRVGVTSATQIQGKELSYNNVNDTDAAFELVSEFSLPAIAIIKHANPCGVALGSSLKEAYIKALACDPISAFGGIIAANRKLDSPVAQEIVKLFAEVVIAPDADPDAKDILSEKTNLRLLITGGMPNPGSKDLTLRHISGGYLLQQRDNGQITEHDLKTVSKRTPTSSETEDLLFAFRVCKHVKSNAIVYAKEVATVGIGAGQMSRVDSSRIAAIKAAEASKAAGQIQPSTIGSVVASDAFFPFADGLLEAVNAGATAIIQPGGSIRDHDVIKVADQNNLAMVFTAMRHFRH